MMELLNWRVWAAIALAMLLAGTHWKAYKVGGADLKAKHAEEKLETAQQTLRILEKNTRVSMELQANSDTLRRNKDAKIDRINSDLSSALERLRDRPARASAGDMPSDTAAGPATGCTGATLWREDSQFLTREAARADRLLADLQQCQTAYFNARAALSK
jgi:hypothetical protein